MMTSIEYAGPHPGRPAGSVICVPLHGPAQPPLGVLNVDQGPHWPVSAQQRVGELEQGGSAGGQAAVG